MMKRPMTVVLASALSVIAGIVAIASFCYAFDPESDKVLWTMGLGLLITVLFFACAGFLYKDGNGTYLSLIFLEFVNGIIIVASIYFECINLWFGITLVIFDLVIILFSIPKAMNDWIISDRA